MPLTLVRVSGTAAPILRCQGDLTVLTVEALRRDLALREGACGERLVLNLTGVRQVDACGVRTLVEAGERLAARGGLLVLVAGGAVLRNLRLLGLDGLLPLYASEAAASSALGAGAADGQSAAA